MKTWKPDTCDCCVEEIYEGSEIVGMGQVLFKCPSHAAVPNNELYDTIYLNDNKVKNMVYASLLEFDIGDSDVRAGSVDKPTRVVDIGISESVAVAGREMKQFKEGVEYAWEFTGNGKNRKLRIEVKGAVIQKAKKDELVSLWNRTFGVKKVEFKA